MFFIMEGIGEILDDHTAMTVPLAERRDEHLTAEYYLTVSFHGWETHEKRQKMVILHIKIFYITYSYLGYAADKTIEVIFILGHILDCFKDEFCFCLLRFLTLQGI